MGHSKFTRFSVALLIVLGLTTLPLASALAAAGDTERVSLSSAGIEADESSFVSSISADGRYVAFGSGATNLVAGDTNGEEDIFVHDRTTGTTERVSVDSSGTQSNGNSSRPSISADGRYVAFYSTATNLVAGDSNGVRDVFVHDRTMGTTERVSIDSSGTQGNGNSFSPSISEDGRYVAFYSDASNLVAGDSNGVSDVFVHDRTTGATERVSVDSSDTEANNLSNNASISAEGRYVAFVSLATNLVAGDSNSDYDIFVHDRTTGVTERVSVDSSGTEGNNRSTSPSISADGRFVAFTSSANNLVSGDSGLINDIFVHDRISGTTERVSVDNSGTGGNQDSSEASISGDGRYVVFWSDANNLVTDDGADRDVFVHDRNTNTTEIVSVSSSGVPGNGFSSSASISSTGRFVVFESYASNLVSGDSNGKNDIFVHQYLAEEKAPDAEASGANPSASKDIAETGTTTLTLGDILISVPASAVAGQTNCRVEIEDTGASGDYGFALDDSVFDVNVVCDGGEVNIFFAPITVCIRPDDGVLNDKQVFHRHDDASSFTGLANTYDVSGYVCGQTRVLSLFTLGDFSLPATGFAPGAQAELRAKAEYAATGLRLSIPELALTTDIVGVPQGPNGWDVSWLGDQAGYLVGTAFPTLTGNTVITAHVWGADNLPGPFYELENLGYGDRFTIEAWGSTYTYEVRSNTLYSPSAISPLGHEDYDWVTLVTCQGYDDATGQYIYRRVVRAVLVSVD